MSSRLSPMPLGLIALLVVVALALLVVLLAWSWQVIARRRLLARPAVAVWQWIGDREVTRASRVRFPRVWAFLAQRVAQVSVFGLHLSLGVGVTLAAMLLFAKVADDVVEQDELARFDAVAATVVAGQRTATDVAACNAVSWAGAPVTIGVLAVVVALVLGARRQWRLAGMWAATIAGGGLLNQLLKSVFQRARPAGAEAFLHGTSWSFPSGHAMGATVCYGMLAFLLAPSAPRGAPRAAILALAGSLIALISASRVCLGVHYATDIFGALAAGALWLAACIAGVVVAGRREDAVAPQRVEESAVNTLPPVRTTVAAPARCAPEIVGERSNAATTSAR